MKNLEEMIDQMAISARNEINSKIESKGICQKCSKKYDKNEEGWIGGISTPNFDDISDIKVTFSLLCKECGKDKVAIYQSGNFVGFANGRKNGDCEMQEMSSNFIRNFEKELKEADLSM